MAGGATCKPPITWGAAVGRGRGRGRRSLGRQGLTPFPLKSPGPWAAGVLVSPLFYGALLLSFLKKERAAFLDLQAYCLKILLPVSCPTHRCPCLAFAGSPLSAVPQMVPTVEITSIPPGPTEEAHSFSPLSHASCFPHTVSQRGCRGLFHCLYL